MRFFISGSAALNADIAEWFHAAGILILEGYGMTENAAGATVNHPDDYKMGTVGPAFPGSEVKLGEGDEGRLVVVDDADATAADVDHRARRSAARSDGRAEDGPGLFRNPGANACRFVRFGEERPHPRP